MTTTVLLPDPTTPLSRETARAAFADILDARASEDAIAAFLIAMSERGGLMHGKTSPVVHDDTGLYAGLPSPFIATRYHSLIVNAVPDTLVVNATAQDGSVMGFRHTTLPIHGVQFHPESIATEHGHAMLANFLTLAGISHQLPDRLREGLDR